MNLYSYGKLLITGEYLVLDGAEAFALPLSCGQSLNYKEIDNNLIKWTSYDMKNHVWFNTIVDKDKLEIIESSDYSVSKRLNEILKSIRNHNSNFLNKKIHLILPEAPPQSLLNSHRILEYRPQY